MILKIGVNGASGRMGKEICGLLSQNYYLDDVALELSDVVTGGQKFTSIEGVPVRTLDQAASESIHVWIDFSQPEATMKLLKQVECPVVIGTTGFSPEQQEEVLKFSKNQAVLLAPNTSPGMNLMLNLLSRVPTFQKLGMKPVMHEEHHRHKKDSPSGSARKILEVMGERGYDSVDTHVTRAGGIVGVHSVKFISDHEELEIIHRVSDRAVFAHGALRGAVFMGQEKRNPGIYRMQDVFEMETT